MKTMAQVFVGYEDTLIVDGTKGLPRRAYGVFN